MNTPMDIYIPVSVVMFLEFAVWGAWAPVLAARLLGPLKLTGKQTGWVYGTLPLASIFAPLVAGQVADQWVNTEWLLAGAHFLGAVLLFVVVRQKKFVPLFITMLLYSCCYAATLPLVNKLVFVHCDAADFSMVFLWAPVSWALVGYALTGWRQIKGEGDGSDCLIFAGVLSVVMGMACLFAPHTPPAAESGGLAIVGAFSLLADSNFLIFILVSLVVAGLMQFYFMGTARFMTDIGIAGKFVPGAMAIAQAAQAIATFVLMNLLIDKIGFQWTLAVGAACWLVMYAIYIGLLPRAVIVAAQSLHGIAYVLFIIVGWTFANEFAPPSARGSVQALVFAATTGLGLFICTQMAGVVMDRFSVEGKFQWRKIWTVPAVLMALGLVVLATALRGEVGIVPIVNQIDANDDGKIDRAEIDQVASEGITSAAFSFDRQQLIGVFQIASPDGKPLTDKQFVEALSGVPWIVAQVDANHDQQITQAEVDGIPTKGLESKSLGLGQKVLVSAYHVAAEEGKPLTDQQFAKALSGLPRIVAQIDSDGNAQVTRAEVDAVAKSGMKVGKVAFSREELIEAFEKTAKNQKAVSDKDFAAALEPLFAEKAKKAEDKQKADKP